MTTRSIFLTLLLFIINVTIASTTKIPTIAISQIVRHPALDKTYQGILDELIKNRYVIGQNIKIIYDCAHGDLSLLPQISQKFINQEADLFVGIGTPSAQSLAKYALKYKIPLVFSSVTDPIGANLASSLDNPSPYITGVSNWIEVLPQLEIYKKILPTLKVVGIIYNPSEANSVKITREFTKNAPKLNLKIITAVANKTGEIPIAIRTLVTKAELILVHNDNTALSAITQIIKIATKYQIPVICSDLDTIKLGVLASLGPDQYQIGKETGKIIITLLTHKQSTSIPIKFPSKTELYINSGVAKTLKIVLSTEIMKMANKIIKEPA